MEPSRLDSFPRIVGRNADMLDCEIMYRRRYLFGVWRRRLAAASCVRQMYADIEYKAIELDHVYSPSIHPIGNTTSSQV